MSLPSSWTVERVYPDIDEYFRDLISSIDSARVSIEMETYIYEKGILADRVCAALGRAAGRGVKVRVLVDGIGSPGFMRDYEHLLRSYGVVVAYYRIWPWVFRHLPGEPRSLLGQLIYRLGRLNKGDHRKVCIIDERTLWVGSANISDVHLREVYGENAWRDLGVLVEGEDVHLARKAFNNSFERGGEFKAPRLSRLLAINQTFAQRRRQRAIQWRRLKRARHRIWIQTPYFVPLSRVLRRLIRKARAGADVRILVPAKSDIWVMPWLSYSFLQVLVTEGVKVFEYETNFVHQKLYLIDDWICLGSTNLNHRSFLHDLEIDVVISHPDNKLFLENQFLADQAMSSPFTLDLWNAFPFWKRFFYKLISYYFSYFA